MGQSSPPSPNRPSAPGSGGPGGQGGRKDILGTRAAPNGSVMGRANSFAAGFLQDVPGAARLAQEMYAPAPPSPKTDWTDVSRNEAVELYQQLAARADPASRRELDLLAARLQDGEG